MNLPGRIAETAVTVLGCWGIYAWICIYSGTTFTWLVRGIPLPILASLGVLWWLHTTDEPDAEATEPVVEPPDRRAVVALTIAAVGFVVWPFGLPYAVPVVAASIGLGLLVDPEPVGPVGRATPFDGGWLLAAVAVAVVMTLGLHRPSIDDAYYVNAIVSSLTWPDRAVLSFDGMHGDTSLPLQQSVHRAQTIELLVAGLVKLGLGSVETLYYAVLPVVAAALGCVGAWLVAARIAPGMAGPAALATVAALLWWGDEHDSYGNWAYVRLFQGKGWLVTALLPFILHFALEWMRRQRPRDLVLLGLAQVAAAAMSTNGLFLAPLASGIALLAAATPTSWRAIPMGLATSAAPVVVLLLVRWEMFHDDATTHDGPAHGVSRVLGLARAGPALALFALVPLLFRGWVGRYVLLAFVLLFNGVTGPLLGRISEVFTFRIFWIVPLPILLATAFVAAFRLDRPVRTGVAVAAALVFVMIGPPTTIPANHNVTWSWATARRPQPAGTVARAAAAYTVPGTLMLAPSDVANWAMHDVPPAQQVYVRRVYFENMRRSWTKREAADRELLTNPRGIRNNPRLLNELCVSVVVTHSRKTVNLRPLGFARVDDIGRFVIWARPAEAMRCVD